jgi:hypothetical protein
MPQHEYTCDTCSWEGTKIVSHAVRDEQTCAEADCTGKLIRAEISLPQVGRSDDRYQMQAILGDGSKVKGNFGKSPSINKGNCR